MTAEEQRLIALVLTDDAECERRLRDGGTVVGIEGAAIRRFAASLTRKRLHAARHAKRGDVKRLPGRLLARAAELLQSLQNDQLR